MAKHLTDRQKKKIIADYTECENYSQVARKHKISVQTVRRAVLQDSETAKKVKQQKERNTADILSFMEEKKEDVCDIIGLYLEYLKDPQKLSRASVQSIATSLGIIIDKFTKDAEKQANTALFENIVKAAGGKFETS